MGVSFGGADLVLYVLILARVAGIASGGPVFGDPHIPTRVRVAISALIALIVFPVVVSGALASGLTGPNLAEPGVLAVLVLKETLVGLIVGYMARLLFYSLQMAAHLVDFQMGLGMAAVYDPSLGAHASPIGGLVNWVALVLFLGVNGHHQLIRVIADSFQTLPIGWAGTHPGQAILGPVVEQLVHTTQISLSLFGPLLVVLGVAELALGILSKAAPQMNILMVSMPVKILLGFVGILLWVGTVSGPLARFFASELAGLPHFLKLLGR